jgi:hypothetical protein
MNSRKLIEAPSGLVSRTFYLKPTRLPCNPADDYEVFDSLVAHSRPNVVSFAESANWVRDLVEVIYCPSSARTARLPP